MKIYGFIRCVGELQLAARQVSVSKQADHVTRVQGYGRVPFGIKDGSICRGDGRVFKLRVEWTFNSKLRVNKAAERQRHFSR
jgi:hypothetical protein